MQEIGVESTILNDIVEGKKTYEGRLGKAKFLALRAGDTLRIREDVWEGRQIVASIHDCAVVRIKQVLYFETFEEMLDAVGYQEVTPRAPDAAAAAALYRQFYTADDETEYGVVCLHFALVSPKM